ncbi:MAG TPA: neuroendocrine convertase 1, partial [Thermoanaerobaculia bacterium]
MRSRSGPYRVVVFLFTILVAVSLGAASLPKVPRPNDSEPSEHARKQIQALLKEKASRSRGRKKMDSQLVYGIKSKKKEKIADDVDFDGFQIFLPLDANGDAIVDISARVDGAFLGKLRAMGAKVLIAHPQYDSVRAVIALELLDDVADLPEVRYIQPMQDAITSQVVPFDPERLTANRPDYPDRNLALSGAVAQAIEEFQAAAYNVGTAGVRKSEADVTHRAALARNTYGVDGSGVKIGVLSDGVRNLAAAQASGDVGPVTVLAGQSGLFAGQCGATAACDEGTAMLELVHDIAPGAQLYFATALGGTANFANNIRQLRAAGCDIIVDDVFYFAESPFQDGPIAQAVLDVTGDGALYFSSAGNEGNVDDRTAGNWEGDYTSSGVTVGKFAGYAHDFDPGPGVQAIDPVSEDAAGVPAILQWADPLGGSGNDYDLYAIGADGTVTAFSNDVQDGDDQAFEGFVIPGGTLGLVVTKFRGDDRYVQLTAFRGRFTDRSGLTGFVTPGVTRGHSAVPAAFSVAAVPAAEPFTREIAPGVPNPSGPYPGSYTPAQQSETFTSDGPRRVFFRPDGAPITPGNFTSTGGEVRRKPDVAAADGVTTTVPGFERFFG